MDSWMLSNGWDIQKQVNGAFLVDEGSGLKRVWNEGNDGSWFWIRCRFT